MKHGVVTNTVNNSTHLRHASSLDYFNRTRAGSNYVIVIEIVIDYAKIV